MEKFYALTVFVLAVWGLANAVTVLDAGKPIRRFLRDVPVLGKMFQCPACLGFWIGMAASWSVFSPSLSCVSKEFPDPRVAAMVADGLVCSGVNWILHVLCERLEFVPSGSVSVFELEEEKRKAKRAEAA